MLVLVINTFIYNAFCINIITIYTHILIKAFNNNKKEKYIFTLSFPIKENFDIVMNQCIGKGKAYNMNNNIN
jgi:hypothetical protein